MPVSFFQKHLANLEINIWTDQCSFQSGCSRSGIFGPVDVTFLPKHSPHNTGIV
jgi:hypothetical protein